MQQRILILYNFLINLLIYIKKSIWWLLPLKFFEFPNQGNSKTLKSKSYLAEKILEMVKIKSQNSYEIIISVEDFFQNFVGFFLGKDVLKNKFQVPKSLLNITSSNLILPSKKFLFPNLPSKKRNKNFDVKSKIPN